MRESAQLRAGTQRVLNCLLRYLAEHPEGTTRQDLARAIGAWQLSASMEEHLMGCSQVVRQRVRTERGGLIYLYRLRREGDPEEMPGAIVAEPKPQPATVKPRREPNPLNWLWDGLDMMCAGHRRAEARERRTGREDPYWYGH